ncbi:spore coat protein CotJB [Clostridium gasigenes]|uniref:spore coat protein CotJB n=1 Tax=Clostridium gasigenes TaxID=94869 RepID=UPI001624BD32|nr:spore coat protein CotJB [Clostridium gasigenes]MBB6625598.1 spore coat protein CotJB [Clostridium gasigenes]MBU3090300.1 spore coat protein CotJB [Clostridium gasigenes]
MRNDIDDIDKMELLKQITTSQFMKVDLALYLNTHPSDKHAIKKYNYYVMLCKGLRETYEINYGMLTQHDSSNSSLWQWISEPWPWESDANFKIEREDI